MTIRDVLNRKKRLAMARAFLGLAMVPLGIYLTILHQYFLVILPAGFLLFVLGLNAANQGLKCPMCKEAGLGSAGGKAFFSIDGKIRFCPCCGIGIDTELRDGVPVFGPPMADERFAPRQDSAIRTEAPGKRPTDERTWTPR